MADPFASVSFDPDAVDKAGEVGGSTTSAINTSTDAAIAAMHQATAAIAAGQAQAAQAILAATELSVKAQKQFFLVARRQLKPFIDYGVNALPSVTKAYEDTKALVTPEGGPSAILQELEQTPGYQFALQEGQKAIDRAAAAPGGQAFDSPATALAAAEYNQNLATQTLEQERAARALIYDQAFNQAALGANAAGNLANAAGSTGANIGQTLSNQGTSLANVFTTSAANTANVFGSIASLEQQRGSDLANIALAQELGRQSLTAQKQASKNQLISDALGTALGFGLYKFL